MIERGITRRYVSALFDLAVEAKVEKKVQTDLEAFTTLMAESQDLRQVLHDPRVPIAKKKSILSSLLPDSFQDLSQDFLLMVVERNRVAVLEGMSEIFGELLRDHQQVALVEVTSAAKLDSETRSALQEKLEKVTRCKVNMQATVDSELMGGLKIRIGSTLFDGSLQRALEDMRASLQDVPLPLPEPVALVLEQGAEPAAEADSGSDEEQKE